MRLFIVLLTILFAFNIISFIITVNCVENCPTGLETGLIYILKGDVKTYFQQFFMENMWGIFATLAISFFVAGTMLRSAISTAILLTLAVNLLLMPNFAILFENSWIGTLFIIFFNFLILLSLMGILGGI